MGRDGTELPGHLIPLTERERANHPPYFRTGKTKDSREVVTPILHAGEPSPLFQFLQTGFEYALQPRSPFYRLPTGTSLLRAKGHPHPM